MKGVVTATPFLVYRARLRIDILSYIHSLCSSNLSIQFFHTSK